MQKIFSSKSGWLFSLTGLILVNVLASFWPLRFDLTSEGRYTLSAPVRKMLGNIHDEVRIDIYLQGNLKSGLRKLKNSTEALLQEFNDYAHGNIKYRFVDPVAGGDDSVRMKILDSLSRLLKDTVEGSQLPLMRCAMMDAVVSVVLASALTIIFCETPIRNPPVISLLKTNLSSLFMCAQHWRMKSFFTMSCSLPISIKRDK